MNASIDPENDHPDRREADRLLDLLVEGQLQEVLEQLRRMKWLGKIDLEILADLLEGKTKGTFFRRALIIVGTRRGRPAKLLASPAHANQFDAFLRSIQERNAKQAAAALRKLNEIGSDQLNIIADLMDPKIQKQSELRLVPKSTGKGRPIRSVKERAEEFVIGLRIDATPGKKYTKIEEIKHRSRATVYRIRSRHRARQSES